MRLRSATRILGTLFVLTGCAGLLAEQCFEKLLSNLVGASTPAAAVVLAVYFLGLCLGSAAYPSLASRVRAANPLRIYAALELGVAAWSVVLLVGAGPGVAALAPVLKLGRGHFWALEALRFAVACVWILPPTLLMGLSFPAIVDALEQLRVPRARQAMARFYSLNILGAIVGAVTAPYFILPAAGLSGTLLLTSVIDGGVGGAAAVLATRVKLRPPRVVSQAALNSPLASDAEAWAVLALAFASGFVAFSLEVLWTQLNGVVLGNSIYGFAAMLASVLIGLGLGGVLSTRLFSDARPVPADRVGWILLGLSALLLLEHAQWPAVPLSFLRWGNDIQSFWAAELFRWAQSARLLIPPATAMGMVYPALFRLEPMRRPARARAVAAMGALNSLGCVLGALVTGFALIPALTSETTERALGVVVAAMAALLVASFARGRRRAALLAGAAMLALGWGLIPRWDRLVLTCGANVYFGPHMVFPDSELLSFEEDTLGGITTVVRDGPALVLLTNGKFQANDSNEVPAQAGFATVPVLFAPHTERGLVIGLGSGYSARVLHDLGVKHLDIAEIAPGIVSAARTWFGGLNGGILDQPGISLHMDDGRNDLLLTDSTYDLISMELSSVWFAGTTSLYSLEFYQLARRHLAEDGVFQQWVQFHHIGEDEVGSIITTLRAVFPYVELWLEGHQGVLVASDKPLQLRSDAIRQWMANPPGTVPKSEGQQRLVKILRGRLLGAADVDRIASSGRYTLNTDANRHLEYATPRYAVEDPPASRAVTNLFPDQPAPAQLDAEGAARPLLTQAEQEGPLWRRVQDPPSP